MPRRSNFDSCASETAPHSLFVHDENPARWAESPRVRDSSCCDHFAIRVKRSPREIRSYSEPVGVICPGAFWSRGDAFIYAVRSDKLMRVRQIEIKDDMSIISRWIGDPFWHTDTIELNILSEKIFHAQGISPARFEHLLAPFKDYSCIETHCDMSGKFLCFALENEFTNRRSLLIANALTLRAILFEPDLDTLRTIKELSWVVSYGHTQKAYPTQTGCFYTHLDVTLLKAK